MTQQRAIFGKLAQACGQKLPLKVCRSQAGYYLGTQDEQGCPYSRESAEYWRTDKAASQALETGRWTQRQEP